MRNISTHTKRLIELYRDTEFKASFTQNYLRRFSLARIEQEYVWAFSAITNSIATASTPSLSSLSNESIKRILLSMSTAGLSFDPQEKHFYLNAEIGANGTLIPRVILGYLGMKQLAMNSGLVSSIDYDIAHEGDSFTWYGPNKEPAFSSSNRNFDNEIICGYVCLYMKDGTVHSYRMSSSALLSMEATDIQMRENMGKESSLYNGPWRERCLRIALWRCAYHEFKHMFTADELLLDKKYNKTHSDMTLMGDKYGARLNNTAEVVL